MELNFAEVRIEARSNFLDKICTSYMARAS